MKTEWDYTNLAKAYLKRATYSSDAIDTLFELAKIKAGDTACDVGAGVAHLTKELLSRDLQVTAVEPNDEMRKYGKLETSASANVTWFEGTGEQTGQADQAFDLVTFGSSFNVTDRLVTLAETKRILKPNGWFACMWNHRDLDDPFQHEIESIIKSHIDGYNYGTRREDQTEVINQSGLFEDVHYIEGQVEHYQTKEDLIEAWRSHATLERQAGDKFSAIIDAIQALVDGYPEDKIKVPYTTRMWCAKLK
ncbi:class I SAM-dependent methyltransferase [Aliagarivorans marinus]|uniref:class I SAM-dependent methyltransferase n=1 Tax=Aliagarivorans marinus TaxID=561965 RepID=UPI000423174F|nr:class I SAM-dependent methyltransferase [Aliagarivorans marinus]